MKQEKRAVSIAKLKGTSKEDVAEGLDLLLDSLGGLQKSIPPARGPEGRKRVLIKPNLMTGAHWESGITVHPYLIELLVGEIKSLGHEPVVGEGAGWGCDSRDAFEATGVDLLCKRIGVPLIDFKRGKGVAVPVPKGGVIEEVLVDEAVLDCDFIISLAKMKTHCETLVSLSLKNMKGLIAEDRQRLRFHLLDVNRCLIDLNRTFRPDLAIIEGIVALEGIGPLVPGRAKPLGLLIGGQDPVAVDSVCVRIMGHEPDEIRHILYAHEAGIGTMDEKEIQCVGVPLGDIRPASWEFPPLGIDDLSPFDNIRVVNGNPCSNCIASLASYLHGYIDENIIENATHSVDLLIGAKATSRGTGSEIAIGNCLKRYRGTIPFVSGCPPPSDAYLELIERGLRGSFVVATVDQDGRVVDVEPERR
jgi:uncharacterized protein (DUF362 family)